jgi:hypothetical protein
MNACPICRTDVEFLSVTKSSLCEDLINELIEEPQIVNYYTTRMKTSNIINYYLRKPNIECPICFNYLSNPKILSCGHVLCADCNNKINWSRGKFILAHTWRNKYYQIVLNNQSIILRYNRYFIKLKKDIQELIHYRDHFKEKMQYYRNKVIVYNKQLNKGTHRKLTKKSKDNYHTKICKWWIKGTCKYSDKECSFAHGNKFLVSNIC